MELTLEPKIVVKQSLLERFVQEIEEKPFLYLGSGYWYSTRSDCVYKCMRGKLEFVAEYGGK